MKVERPGSNVPGADCRATGKRLLLVAALLAIPTVPLPVLAQTAPAVAPVSPRPAAAPAGAAPARPGAGAPQLRGRRVEDVRIVGNAGVSSAVILNVVRTRQGDALDPATVEEDYQRVYALKKFSNVEARAEPTATGVIVVFEVTEQRTVTSVVFRGNAAVNDATLAGVVDLRVGQAIDRFRISLSRAAIENLYRAKNYPYAHVAVDQDRLTKTGDLVFNVVEGPNVRVRKVAFSGNRSFSASKLKGQLKTKSWLFIFRPGTFDPETVNEDVAALRKFYQDKGFFDVRVGRKVVVSPDQTELQVTFVVDEGVRYTIDKVTFKGNASLSEAEIRRSLKLVEGQAYDNDILQRDVRQVVKAYSPFGFIYQPSSQDPDYLRVDTKPVFRREAGTVELVYDVSEGKAFRVGRILVKGNSKTLDKVVLREMHVAPGQLYNSGELADAADRLKGTPLFGGVSVTPIGSDPNVRDVLVEVQEARTASFSLGAGVNSNGGVGGNITYEQKNFDVGNPPASLDDVISERSFVGAGQTLRISLEPGTQQTNATVRFFEPYLLDQPYSLGLEAYYRDRQREVYRDTRGGGRATLGKRFDYVYSATLSLRGEDVNIHDIEDDPIRADEILSLAGHSLLTSAGVSLRRDTTTRGLLPDRGTTTTVGWESYGALGGDYTFQKFTASWDWYHALREDLLDRRTILTLHADAGYIAGTSPFFERFYGGGIGSVRGFSFRGITPRSGPDEDRVGGDFSVTGGAEVSFPITGDNLRGVVFTDAGTVEREFEVGTIRSSVGAGIRLTLPFFGQAPLAIDLAYPITKDRQDDVQYLSFSFGFLQ